MEPGSADRDPLYVVVAFKDFTHQRRVLPALEGERLYMYVGLTGSFPADAVDQEDGGLERDELGRNPLSWVELVDGNAGPEQIDMASPVVAGWISTDYPFRNFGQLVFAEYRANDARIYAAQLIHKGLCVYNMPLITQSPASFAIAIMICSHCDRAGRDAGMADSVMKGLQAAAKREAPRQRAMRAASGNTASPTLQVDSAQLVGPPAAATAFQAGVYLLNSFDVSLFSSGHSLLSIISRDVVCVPHLHVILTRHWVAFLHRRRHACNSFERQTGCATCKSDAFSVFLEWQPSAVTIFQERCASYCVAGRASCIPSCCHWFVHSH